MSEPFLRPEDDAGSAPTHASGGNEGPAHATAPQPDEPEGADDLPGHPVAEESPRVEP